MVINIPVIVVDTGVKSTLKEALDTVDTKTKVQIADVPALAAAFEIPATAPFVARVIPELRATVGRYAVLKPVPIA